MVRSASLPKGIEVTHELANWRTARLLATHCDPLADLADYCSTGCKGMPGVASGPWHTAGRLHSGYALWSVFLYYVGMAYVCVLVCVRL